MRQKQFYEEKKRPALLNAHRFASLLTFQRSSSLLISRKSSYVNSLTFINKLNLFLVPVPVISEEKKHTEKNTINLITTSPYVDGCGDVVAQWGCGGSVG
jgi:hypothetical protein